MLLTRVHPENDLLATLERQWRAECERFNESLDDYAAPHLSHARQICSEMPQDPKYGVFALHDENDVQALMHLNKARLPGTDGATLRLLWVLLAPRFDYEEIKAKDLARLATGIISGALNVSSAEMQSDQIKIHMSGIGDRRFFHGVASALAGDRDLVAEIKANWLHIAPVR